MQSLRAKRSPDRPFGEQLSFDSSTVAERRRFEIVNPTALNAPTLELAVWASVPTPTASRGWEVHSPFFLQCKGKGVNGQRRRESQAAGAAKSRPSVAVVACLLARAAAQVGLQSRHYKALGAAHDFRDADGLTVPSFGQAQVLARIWLEVKARKLAGHPEPLRGTFTVAAAVNQHPTRPPGRGSHAGWCVCPNLHHHGVLAPRTAGVDVKPPFAQAGSKPINRRRPNAASHGATATSESLKSELNDRCTCAAHVNQVTDLTNEERTNRREGKLTYNSSFIKEKLGTIGAAVTRWLWALIVVVVLVALGAFFWATLHRTIVASHVIEAPAPTLAAPPPASVAQTSPSAPPSAPVAQSSPATAPASGSQTSPSAPAPAQTPAPTPVAQTAPSALSPVPAAQARAPASAGATAGEVADATPGSSDKAASELASLKPGFGAGDLVSALNRSKFNFASASAEVPAEMVDFLKSAAADEMKRLPPGHVLEIAGYTDSSGNPAKNVTLSQKRAEAVREALIEAGANADTLVAKGYGSADPIASNGTPEGRLRNRRIEFHVVRTP